METNKKAAKFFSSPLMKQNIKSNWLLTLVICFVLCLMTAVVSFSMSLLGNDIFTGEKKEAQTDLYKHLFAIVTYNQMTGSNYTLDDFIKTDNKTAFDTMFQMMNQQSQETNFSSERLSSAIELLNDDKGAIDNFVKQFEYIYALSDEQGIFSNQELTVDDMLKTLLSSMGLPVDQLQQMAEMDKTAMLNKMYFTEMGILPIFLFVVIVGNSLIVNQVDSGSMAYVLATPTKRSAVAYTQTLFLVVSPLIICVVGCIARIVSSAIFMDKPDIAMNIACYFGMYLLAQAVAGICYMGSCLFNQSRKSLAFGGGIAVWCFIASLLGMFGADDMVKMGMGIEELDVFNKLTLAGLFDINALSTVGTNNVDYAFIWKLCLLAIIAIATYTTGNIHFQKKDLPL